MGNGMVGGMVGGVFDLYLLELLWGSGCSVGSNQCLLWIRTGLDDIVLLLNYSTGLLECLVVGLCSAINYDFSISLFVSLSDSVCVFY